MSTQHHRDVVEQSLLKAEEKAASWNPTKAELHQYKRQVEQQKRTGGELRGNSKDRARSKQNLLNEFGDGTHTHCVYCGTRLNMQTITRDKIIGQLEGGRYTLDNLIPSCLSCNSARKSVSIIPLLRRLLKEFR